MKKKVGKRDRMLITTTEAIRRRTETKATSDRNNEDCRKKDEEILRLKCVMTDLQRKTGQ